MSEVRHCRQCGKTFAAQREDHIFCSPKCVAAYYRDNPDPEYIHAEKYREHTFFCEHCGNAFRVNDYAKRGGQRRPKYCSNKCKQAAYRARGMESQQQAKRRNEKSQQGSGAGYTGQTGGNAHTNAGNTPPNAKKDHSKKRKDFWDGYKDRWTAAMAILNVQNGFSSKQLRKAWMDLLKQVHPDVSNDPEATYNTQRVNWAYEYLSKP